MNSKWLQALVTLGTLALLSGCGYTCQAAEIATPAAAADTSAPQPPATNVYLWPLYESTANSKTVLYPFYVREGDFRMLFPFYYRTNQGHDQHFLWPLVKLSDGKPTRLMPVWYRSDEGSFTLFPLMHQSPESTFWLLPPLYTRHDGKFFAAYPFFARGEDFWFAFPSIYRSTQEGDTLRVWPLYYHHIAPDQFQRRVLCFSHVKNEYRESHFALLYYREENLKNGDTETLVFPYYRLRGKQVGCDALLPLYLHRWNESSQSQTRWIFPYYQSDSKTARQRRVPLVFNWEERTDFDREQVLGREKSFSILWLLYRRQECFDAQDRLLTRSRAFLIFSDELNAEGKRTFRMFGLPIIERNL